MVFVETPFSYLSTSRPWDDPIGFADSILDQLPRYPHSMPTKNLQLLNRMFGELNGQEPTWSPELKVLTLMRGWGQYDHGSPKLKRVRRVKSIWVIMPAPGDYESA